MNRPRVVAIIQARMGSTRLPGKVLLPILGKPMLEHQVERVRRAQAVDDIVIATTTQARDRPILDLAKRLGVTGFAGSEDDVLDRYYQAARAAKADVVIRLTADCPLHDPAVIDRFVHEFLRRKDELDWLAVDPSYPEGLDTEVMSFGALERAWNEARRQYEREHVSVYIWQSGKFRTDRLSHTPDLSQVRLTVDEDRDFQLVTRIYEQLYPRHGHDFTTAQVLQLLQEQPQLMTVNAGITRNEGFLKSLAAERGAKVRQRSGGIANSEAWWKRAKGLIPAGTQTLSKGPTQFVDGVAPKYLQRAKGSHVWDVDGNEYIDYMMGLGSIVLGHNYPATSEAIRQQVEDGYSFTLMHPLEVEVAERLRALVPCAERVRFAKNGSDVTTAAVRVARAYTGRDKVAHCGYHGWHDWYVASTTRRKGVPPRAVAEQFPFKFNDIASLQAIFDQNQDQVAAVIMEPVGATAPDPGFLEKVRDLAHKNGALLIFDEVATGFRYHLGGVHQYLKVDPDLACFGKAMANGMPLSALVGRGKYMDVLEDVFFSFTFGGECLSLASARATIDEMREKKVIPYLWQTGRRLLEGTNRLISDFSLQDHVKCIGLEPRTFVAFQESPRFPALILKSLFQQECIKRGVLFGGAHLPTFSHTEEDVEYTLGVYQQSFELLAKAVKAGDVQGRLEGKPLQPVFRPVS